MGRPQRKSAAKKPIIDDEVEDDEVGTPGEGEIVSMDAVDLTNEKNDAGEQATNAAKKRSRRDPDSGSKKPRKSDKTLTGKREKESQGVVERTLVEEFVDDDDETDVDMDADDGEGMRKEGLPGHVKQIKLVDFMCHDHMTMEFAPHCTFVSGKNGSGKSASLQALQCSLGVKATKHSKAGSLSKLIRTGQDEAVIKVTIWNKPTRDYEAFRHDVYGDFITIERRITKKSHAWAFYSANGKVISRKKDELEQILQTLNLNASNPVTVMTQNTARGLLGSTTAKADHEKYDLYMDATQLGTIAENIAKTKESLNLMSEHVEKINHAYGEMEDKVNDAKSRRDKLLRIEDLKEEMSDLEIVFAMEIILEQEAMRDDLVERLAGLDREDTAKALEESEAKREALHRRQAEITELDAQHVERSKAMTEEVHQLMADLKERKKELQTNKKKVNRYGGLVIEAEGEKQAAEQALEALKDGAEAGGDAGATTQEKENQALNEHLKQLNDATNAKTKALETGQKYEKMYQASMDEVESLKEGANRLQLSMKRHEQHITQLENQLKQQKASAKGSVHEFGNMASKLVDAIDRAHSQGKFSAKPLGPLGRYLGLNDRKYAMSTEEAIGKHLEGYLVTSQRDLDVLTKVFMDAGANRHFMPRIGVINFERQRRVHDVPSSKRPNGPTIMSVLSCEESVRPIVINYLIDIARIESTALAPSTSSTQAECTALAKQPNVSVVFDCQGNRYTARGGSVAFEGFDNGRATRGPRLGLSKQEKVKELEQRIRDARAALTQSNDELTGNRAALRKAVVAQEDYKSKLIAARLALDEARGNLTMLETTRDRLEDVAQAPEDGFMSQIQTQAANIMEFQSKVEDAKARIDTLNQEIGVLEERRVELGKQMDARDESIEMLKESQSSVKKEIKKIEQYIAKLNQVKDAQNGKRTQWEQQVKDIQEAIDQSMETTLAIVESRENAAARKQHLVDTYRSKGISNDDIEKLITRKALEKKYQHLAKTIEEAEEEAGGNLADLEVEVANAQEKLAQDGHDMRKNLNLFKGLQDAYKQREAKLFQVDDFVERTVSSKFRHYMRKKGHFGKIVVRRKEKKLEIGVRIGSDKKKESVIKDLKQLSGGERSFATVAFALALGGETDTPFRAMDEFDVFMDSVGY